VTRGAAVYCISIGQIQAYHQSSQLATRSNDSQKSRESLYLQVRRRSALTAQRIWHIVARVVYCLPRYAETSKQGVTVTLQKEVEPNILFVRGPSSVEVALCLGLK